MLSESSIGEQPGAVRFDPNVSKYRCCCDRCHATTGVRIIAGMLCVTVILELWHFIVTAVSSGNGAALVASASQLIVGAAIASTVIYALYTEKAGYLLPYLVLQTIGLAAGSVFLITFLYISLFGTSEAMLAWVETQGHVMDPEVKREFEAQIGLISWLLVIAFAMVIILQVWLISIVVACWRYFRGKRTYGYIGTYASMSYVIFGENGQQVTSHLQKLPDEDVFHSKIDISPSCSLMMSLDDQRDIHSMNINQ